MKVLHHPAQHQARAFRHKVRRLAPLTAALLLSSCFNQPEDLSRAAFGADPEPAVERSSVTTPTTVASNVVDQIGSTEKRVALIIGNSDYSPQIGQLTNPRNDATDMADALRRTGFKVKLLLNATRDEMQRAVLTFDQEMRESDVSLFYYAGHAIQVNGRNFLIPMEANLDIAGNRADTVADYVALETLDIENVLGRMGNAETDLSIVILDACRNNPFSQGARGVTRGLAQTSAPRGTFVAYATAPGKVAHDGDGQNSPYTAAIVKNLEVPGLKLEDVFKRVRQDVALQTNGDQIPWENSSVFGDFYFNPQIPEEEAEPEEPVTVEKTPPQNTPSPEAASVAALSRDDYAEVQELLTRIGFYDGPTEGMVDDKTRNAIIQWQALHGLDLNGEVTKAQIPFMRTDAVRAETRGDNRFERRLKRAKELNPPASREPKQEQAQPAEPTQPVSKPAEIEEPELQQQQDEWQRIIVPPPPA